MRRNYEVAAARSTGLRLLHFSNPEFFGIVSPEGLLGSAGPDAFKVCQLEGEVETATDHSEIIFRSVDHAKAQVVSPTDMPRKSDFEAGTELTEHLGFATEVIRLRMNSESIGWSLSVKDIPLAAAKNCTDPGPRVGRKTRAGNRIAQRERS
jgi:hypothetical protein